ncbi:ATP-binding protein [Candidatus Desantisbacteria bacterium]|nr:ATP-binding protein [Candidatus Desantisbacteria bacterium]
MKLTNQDLQIILQEGEGQTIEFKESFNPSIAKEIIAFVNAIGGKIFVGVSDSGQIKGVSITNSLKSQIADIARNCDPPISVGLQVLV